MNKRLFVSVFAALLAAGTIANAGTASASKPFTAADHKANPPASTQSSDPSGSPSPGSPGSPEAGSTGAETDQQSATPAAKVKINSSLVAFSQTYSAVIRNDRMYVPIRLFEHADIQARVTVYETPEQTDLLIKNFQASIQMEIGQEQYRYYSYKNEQSINMTAAGMAPYREGREVMVPIRPVAEALGLTVLWDQQERAALLQTGEAYRANLNTKTAWEDWLGELPADEAYESVDEITDEEIAQYIQNRELTILDYKHLSKYKSLVLEVRGEEASAYVIQRTRNGNLKSEDVTYWTKADAEGFSAKRGNGYVGIVVHDQASSREVDHAVINFYDSFGKTSVEKVTFQPEQSGMLVKLPADSRSGTVQFYGKSGFTHEVRFW